MSSTGKIRYLIYCISPNFLSYLIPVAILLTLISVVNGCAVLAPVSVATTGMVIADERSVGNQIDDKILYTKIKKEIKKNCVTEYNLQIMEGRVMLVGNAINLECTEELSKALWAIQGIKEVMNELDVGERTLSQTTKDIWIANQARAKFLIEKNFVSVNYEIAVNKGIVYLLGIAQNQDELNKALLITSCIHGVTKVVNHVILKDDPRRWKSF